MNYWLIVFSNGNQTIFNGDYFYDIHANFDSDEIVAVIKLNDDIVEKIVEGVKGKITVDKAKDVLGSIKGLFGK